MELHVGTSGYSYKEWKGSFYPQKLAAAKMLAYYAERLSACEINATFYRMPKAELLEGWRAQVPGSFAFVLKAAKQITHIKRLKDVDEPLAYFVAQARVLGPQLGPILFQLPPHQRKDLERLKNTLSVFPRDLRAAFEFRHASWLEEDTFAVLRAHNAALCVAQADDEHEEGKRPKPALAVPRVSTADFGYLRLRKKDYSRDDLADWLRWVQAQRWADAYVFFKHEDEARGPAYALDFRQLAAA